MTSGHVVEIRPGAYLRGGIYLGDGCVVGASSEVKRSILGHSETAGQAGQVEMVNAYEEGGAVAQPFWWGWYGWPGWYGWYGSVPPTGGQ